MAEIIEVKEEAIVAAVEETSGAATGTKVVSNHSATGANQHSIGAITGLEDRLQTIESLKSTISTKKSGNADYYMWGETWDDEKNTPGHGYFVRLGFIEVEDGKYEERIYKCEGEEAEVQTSLPLETKEVVTDDSAAWSEAGKITTKIYYVAATKTYYNYEVNAWVPYTEEEYKEIALDKIVVKYSYAGEIQTKDIAKYYIVGGFNNETKQWIEPCDIYAYNGIEYIKKPSYGYKNGGVYKNALMDVLGVTVPSSMVGFIGNQGDEDEPKNDETKYALVATTGVVDVLCDHDVAVGDYVQPYACGWAKKSTGSYGYLVTALVQNDKIVSAAGDGLLYARIVLEPSMALDKELSNNVDSLLETTRRLDANIISFGNTASQAYSMADRALKLAQDSATDSKVNSDDANKYAQDAAGSASDAWDKADSAAQSAANAAEAAAKAQKEAAEAREYITEEIYKVRSDASDALALAVDNNLKALRALEYRLDDYSVGRYSQAYGLTWDQAKTILPANETREDGKVHSIVFIPMSEDPLLNDECIYEEVYSATPEDVRKQFMVSYSYVWTNDGWDAGTQNVSFTTTEPVGNEGAYWYVPNSYAGTEFKKEALYHYENGGWVHVATRDENVMGRTVAYINNAADTITQSVTGIAGQVSAIQTKVDKEGAKTSMWASVPTELEGKRPVNYYETGEVPEVVENFVTFTSTSEIDVEIAKGHLEQKTDLYYDEKYNCIYYCIGAALPYQVHRAELVGGKVVFTEELAVTYDGVDLYRVNAASIIAAVNENGDSSLQFNASKIHFTADDYSAFAENIILSADQITMDGEVKFIKPGDLSENGETTIHGSRIQTGTIGVGQLTVSAKQGLVSSIEILYARSSSSTEFIKTTEWSSTAPTWVEGEYMWQKTITTYADHTADKPHTIETKTCIQGAKGEDGTIGDTIVYIETITDQYYLSTSFKEQTGGSWIDIIDNNATLPTEKGKYRFRRQQYTWSDHTEDKSHITYSAVRFDETDQRILDWCSETDSTFIDGGSIYANSITADQLATDSIRSLNYNGTSNESEFDSNTDKATSAITTPCTDGSFLSLKTGEFDSPHFKIHRDSFEATKGIIGGYTLENETLHAGNAIGYVGLDARCDTETISGNEDTKYTVFKYPYAFYAGNENPQFAPFRVTKQGVLTSDAGTFSGSIVARAGSIGPIKFDNNSFNATRREISVHYKPDDGLAISVAGFSDDELKSTTKAQANYNYFYNGNWTTINETGRVYTGSYPEVLAQRIAYSTDATNKPSQIIYTKPNVAFTLEQVQTSGFSYNLENGQWEKAIINNLRINDTTDASKSTVYLSPGGVIYFLNSQNIIMSIYHFPSGNDFYGSTTDNLFTVQSDYIYTGSINCGNKTEDYQYAQATTSDPAEGFYLNKNYFFMSGAINGVSMQVKGDIKCNEIITEGIKLYAPGGRSFSTITFDETNQNVYIKKLETTSIVDKDGDSGYDLFGHKYFLWKYESALESDKETSAFSDHGLSTVVGAIATVRRTGTDMTGYNYNARLSVRIDGKNVYVASDDGKASEGFYCLILGY